MDNLERKHNPRVGLKGEKTHLAKLSDNIVLEIRKRASEGVSRKKLSEDFGTHLDNIASIVTRKTWTHLQESAPEKRNIIEPTEKDLTEMRPIKGYEGLYSVTPDGKVISLDRTVTRVCDGKTVDAVIQKRVRKQGLNVHGYPMVVLCKDGGEKSRTIHTLVADAFLPPPTEGQTHVRHKDGNEANPDVNNLERGTPVENAADRKRHGTGLYGERHPMVKLDDSKVLDILAKAAVGVKRVSIAAEHGVSISSVGGIIRGDNWKHLSNSP